MAIPGARDLAERRGRMPPRRDARQVPEGALAELAGKPTRRRRQTPNHFLNEAA